MFTDAGYSPEEICFFINERIKLENGPAYSLVEEKKRAIIKLLFSWHVLKITYIGFILW